VHQLLKAEVPIEKAVAIKIKTKAAKKAKIIVRQTTIIVHTADSQAIQWTTVGNYKPKKQQRIL
jgi:hypothetical protein